MRPDTIGGGRDATGWVGSESERVSKNGQERTHSCEPKVTENATVGDGRARGVSWMSSGILFSALRFLAIVRSASAFSIARKCAEAAAVCRGHHRWYRDSPRNAKDETVTGSRKRREKERERRVPCYGRVLMQRESVILGVTR